MQSMLVLIVDDDPINLRILEALTEKVGVSRTVSFTSPFEALDWCRKDIPDLVLVDYMMPDINGIEFIRQFRAIEGRSAVPIVMVTGESERGIRYEALNLGANDFLNKPVDSTEFVVRLRNMLILRENQKELSKRADWLQTEVRKATEEVLIREMETIYCLSRATELRDPETGEHILRMTYYSHHIIKKLGMSEDDQDLILKIAPMHDIGKVGIPDNILLKPGKLTEEEFAKMTTHTEIGFNILKESRSKVLKEAAFVALYHHERYDGSGYPSRLKAENIPLFSRATAVADVFDALTTNRPYKKAWKIEEALKYIIESKGKHFDPRCVDAFMSDMDRVFKIKDMYSDKDSLLSQR